MADEGDKLDKKVRMGGRIEAEKCTSVIIVIMLHLFCHDLTDCKPALNIMKTCVIVSRDT